MGTHVNSGLGKTGVASTIETLNDSKKTIQVSCKITGIEQTYLFRPNENVIYMGTYHTKDLVLPELRFLARLDKSVVNAGIMEATIESGMTAIEAEDVVADSKGLTRSKFYSAVPFIDDDVHGVDSSAAGVYFVISDLGYETSSGGPFFRDINNKFDVSNELTFYMNSDHTRIEDYRYGFHGPYALALTSGDAPAASSLDFEFFQDLGLNGFVPSSKRGQMTGTITDSEGVLGDSDVVVGFANANAQYWTKVAAGSKTFTSPLMKAGRYTATVYKKQLAVGTSTVEIEGGGNNPLSLAVAYNMTSNPIWRIGEWDGTPDGFLNADKIHKMHPSDSRMSPWEPLTFTPGSDEDSAFPMAQFRSANDPITISFSLTGDQAKSPRTLKIGLTLAQVSARSSVSVNDNWTAPVPESVAVKTRGVTRGVTVGNYKLYEYTIPVSALVTGTNTIKLTIASGASDPAEKFLAASVVFDALDTGRGLTITMKQSTCDITSIKYNDQELQYKSMGTHVNSGLGKTGVASTIETLNDSKKTIQVSCKITGIEQTYLFRPNENVIYMGTYHTKDLVLPELRFLARLDKSVVNAGIMEATIESGMTAIEAEDVVADSKGLTRSKFYSAVPFIDDDVHGVDSSAAGVYFVISDLGYETSSGGPFFRDINNKFDVSNELTFYMNSDHTRIEDYRYGFHGPYALALTSGDAPAASSLDFEFFQDLGLNGFVPSSKRGQMTGTITDSEGVLGDSDVVVGFANANAQYWTKVAAGSKTFTSPLMKAGRYTATVYKKQLAVGTSTVEIEGGGNNPLSLAVAYNMTSNPIWRIGEWDGTPDGFLNADKIHKMHPSDSRMSPWEPLTFTPGSDEDSAFPMAQFRSANDPITISFSLTGDQAKSPRTLKIGLTLAQVSARSSVSVNDNWTAPVPESVAVKTRGVTRGVTVGNYKLYEYTIPVSALVTGTNTIKLTIASGTSDPAEKFLAASVVFDALELV
ncbi:hypothetical protein BBO99_00003220 [Phytophthora kernoviae]|uniref:Rhamnogalacturonan endolyase n=1 Tax=Phytophthora kernoviae TaxID=325452 RepID=A0A3R7HKI4_9STRA|nr:hypothetical protein JM16_003228 [Phytophthora kernoviae]RLN10944.1 hypothetical protein BBI17_000732 [Phytophthora kernoviae]RLN82038.1 hypothetical protein BBO99_00003220 [Phytophthora kernoviae]